MIRSKRIAPAAAAGVLFGFGAGMLQAAEPTSQELLQQIQQLKSRIDQLEATQSQLPTTREVDAMVQRVLNDAQQRSQLLQMEGFTAGYTRGRFTIQDAQGHWVLRPALELQFRSMTSWRDQGKHAGADNDTENGFSIERAAFGFDGVACDPNLTYMFMWNSSEDGSVALEQAWVRYAFMDNFAIRAGQMRNPVFHEQSIGPTHQLAVDRSMTNALITRTNEAFTQAVTLQYDSKNSPIFAEVGLEDGFSSGNTDFLDPSEGGSSDWGAFARVDYFLKGERGSYGDFTAMGNRDDLLVIGAGGDVTQAGDATQYLHTVDVQWEDTGNLGLYAAYLGNYLHADGVDAGDNFYNWGLVAQAGYMINGEWEAFGRAGYTKFDSKLVPAGLDDSFTEFTVGANWYMCAGHNVKLTLDATVLPNGSPSDDLSLGILNSGNTEVIFRGQFQLLL